MTLRNPELDDVQRLIDRITLAEAGKRQADGTGPLRALSFRRIVLAADGSESADEARAWAQTLARTPGSEVHVVSVIGPPPYSYDTGVSAGLPPISGPLAGWERIVAEEKAGAEAVVEAAAHELEKTGIRPTTEVTIGSPAARIAGIAIDRASDLVVLGSHKHGPVERFLLGSVGDGVKNAVTCSVLIAKSPPQPGRILLPTDGSADSRIAVLTGLALAKQLGVDATVLHVVPAPMYASASAARAAYEEAQSKMAPEAGGAAGGEGGPRYEVAFGDPATRILQAAEKGPYGLIVMGSRGLSPLRGAWVGSVGNAVSHRAKASVLLVKPPR